MKLNTAPRCLLVVPAIKLPQFGHRLDQLDIDGAIFDLEDSVAFEHKNEARQRLQQYLTSSRPETNIYVRINTISSPFHRDDLNLLHEIRPDAVVVSKIESAEDLRSFLSWCEDYKKNTGQTLPVFFAIETLKGYYNRDEILRIGKGCFLFTIGYEDFSAELGIDRPQLDTFNPLSKILIDFAIASKHHDIPMIDSISRKFRSAQLEEFGEEVKLVKNLGLYGKIAIHPNQIDIINSAYNENLTVEQLRATISAFDNLKDGSAVIINGRGEMEDMPSYRRAKNTLHLIKSRNTS